MEMFGKGVGQIFRPDVCSMLAAAVCRIESRFSFIASQDICLGAEQTFPMVDST